MVSITIVSTVITTIIASSRIEVMAIILTTWFKRKALITLGQLLRWIEWVIARTLTMLWATTALQMNQNS